jgi:methylmalonyl-CoA mutase N-terminal domain/subunit
MVHCTIAGQSPSEATMSEPSDGTARRRDRPWIFRTYAGHSTAHDSNALYRRNLGKGQTGLSTAFDLPTQADWASTRPTAVAVIQPRPHGLDRRDCGNRYRRFSKRFDMSRAS